MKREGSAESISRSKSGKAHEHVTCLKTHGISLKAGKRYKVIPDPESAKRGWVRVVDETGEDYCFPQSFFKSKGGPLKPGKPRETDGQYAYDTMALLCVCGHPLGEHAGAGNVAGKRPCLHEPEDDEKNCGCERFRKARNQPERKR